MKQDRPETAWYNFITGEYDYIEGTPEDMHPYLPQDPSAQGLFNTYIAMGLDKREAAKKTLLAVLGIKEDE